MKDSDSDPSEPTCTCVIDNIPGVAISSMRACPAHGDKDELAPLPGQGLNYCVLIGRNDQSSGVFTNTVEGIEEARYLARHLGYDVQGVYAMSSLADLREVANKTGSRIQAPPPTGMTKRPRNLLPVQVHDKDCLYAAQGHPGGCYTKAANVWAEEH
jgi:hypothetical protein